MRNALVAALPLTSPAYGTLAEYDASLCLLCVQKIAGSTRDLALTLW